MTLYNLEAEQALLGAVLFDNRLLERLPILDQLDFAAPAHVLIWRHVLSMKADGQLADPVTLKARLEADGQLADLGGPKYLLSLLDRAARFSTDALSYAHLIRDLSAKRRIELAVKAAMERMASSEESAADVLASLETDLRGIELGGVQGRSLREAASDLIQSLNDPSQRPSPTGFRCLDERLGGWFPGDFILLAGRPSMGKTAAATNFARAAANVGRRVHFESYEMSDKSIAARSLSAQAFNDREKLFAYAALRRGEGGFDVETLREIAARLSDNLIISDRGQRTLAGLEASVRNTVRWLGGVDLIVVDYLQLMRSSARGNRNEQTTDISQGLKALAVRFQAPLIALSQLSRENEKREDKRPQLSDLRDSGSLEQDADVVLGVYREHYYLSRSQPQREHFKSDDEFVTADLGWDRRMRETERSLEFITLKQRMGPTGSDTVDFWDRYDVALDQGTHKQ